MSNVEFITFTELLSECNLDDPKVLQKILRTNRLLPRVSHNKSISRKDADEIVTAITGHPIDWMKYKISKKDAETDGPLIWGESSAITDIVKKWFEKVEFEGEFDSKGYYLVGVVCKGGFLVGQSDSEFALSFSSKINIIIGDRGSGKSTVLNLLGSTSDSIGDETRVLVQKLVSALYPSHNGFQNEVANLNKRALKVLQHYGIDLYAIYIYSKEKYNCYFVDKKERKYSFLSLVNGEWIFNHDGVELLSPSMLFLGQGEVIRIAEDRDKKFYLNNIVDAIYPELFEKRTKLIQLMQQLMHQYAHYKADYMQYDMYHVQDFLNNRYKEIYRMQHQLNKRQFDESNDQIINYYIDQFENYHYKNPVISWINKPLIDLLQANDDELLCYLFIYKIRGFLGDKIKAIRNFRKTNRDLMEVMEVSQSISSEIYDIEAESDNLEIEEAFGAESPETENLDDQDAQLFLDAVALPEIEPIDPELHGIASDTVQFLRNRLKVINGWVKIYRNKHQIYNAALHSLIQNYVVLLNYKIELIEEQEKKCNNITNLLNKDNLAIKISTASSQEAINKIKEDIRYFEEAGNLFDSFANANINTKLHDLYEVQTAYDNIIDQLHDELYSTKNQISNNNHDYIYYPISIELRQGNAFRDFDQLSFGQKSGIILKMVLTTTDKSSIVIDQPEDNLDAYSIINIISPALKTLCDEKQRQIILVTHNSNLVMTLNAQNLLVLEARGENGIVKFRGLPSLSQNATQEIFDILEGGVQTFEQKIRTYEEFIGTVRGHIRDMDIQLIETSFRKRTIDGLRNYLQPIVSDGSLLDFLRHQLKQWSPESYREQIQVFIRKLEKLGENPKNEQENLLETLNELSTNLEYHVHSFQNAIDEIRLMDTQPRFGEYSLYNVIDSINNEQYIRRPKESRSIDILVDERLKDVYVYADINHLRLIFRNLIGNSLRATEAVAIDMRRAKKKFVEQINIDLESMDKEYLMIRYLDNGAGIPKQILEKLYKEPCSTKPGKDHGLGGIIIRKLLEINGGRIEILNSTIVGAIGTHQLITLRNVNNIEVRNAKNNNS